MNNNTFKEVDFNNILNGLKVKKINEKDGAGFLAYFDTQKTIMGDGETQLEAVLDLLKGPFRILCQLGKIENTKGHKYENRNRCRAIC